MIKSTFSRKSTNQSPSCSSKKPSLASLAQKLQDVDLDTKYSLPDDGVKKRLMPFCVTDDGNSVLTSSGELTAVADSNEDYCSNIEKLTLENVGDVDGVFSRTSQTVCQRYNVVSAKAACCHMPDGNGTVVESCNNAAQKRSDASSADAFGSQNDCSLQFHQLHINPSLPKRRRLAKPTPFGLALSAVPNPSVRVARRRQKVVLYTRFSYSRQTAAFAGICRHVCTVNSQAIIPFDFSTPSPDDIVRQKQKMAFGASSK